MNFLEDCPPCNNTNCFANANQTCGILIDTDFGKRKICPFFKTTEQFEADRKKYDRTFKKIRRKRR